MSISHTVTIHYNIFVFFFVFYTHSKPNFFFSPKSHIIIIIIYNFSYAIGVTNFKYNGVPQHSCLYFNIISLQMTVRMMLTSFTGACREVEKRIAIIIIKKKTKMSVPTRIKIAFLLLLIYFFFFCL